MGDYPNSKLYQPCHCMPIINVIIAPEQSKALKEAENAEKAAGHVRRAAEKKAAATASPAAASPAAATAAVVDVKSEPAKDEAIKSQAADVVEVKSIPTSKVLESKAAKKDKLRAKLAEKKKKARELKKTSAASSSESTRS